MIQLVKKGKTIERNNQRPLPKETVKLLMASLVQNVHTDIFWHSKILYKMGETALPELVESIVSYDWSNVENKGQIRQLCGIASLINDIDEKTCKKTVQTIYNKGCTRVVKQCLNSVVSFTLKDYRSYQIVNINIYISKDFKDTETIYDQLKKWLSNVPKDDFTEIDRIYIIPDQTNYLYRGTYMPVLSYITLIWDVEHIKSLFWKRINLLTIEHTLYHEFGHHHYKHTFGQDETQEMEADKYAAALIKKAHPYLNILMSPLRLFKKRTKPEI